MLDHGGRRQLLYNAVTLLEPYASAALIQHYVSRRHGLILPMLRIYVDLERLTRAGHLARALTDVGLRFSGRRPASSWSSLSEFHQNGLPQEHPSPSLSPHRLM